MTGEITIIVYSKNACVACNMTKKNLKRREIGYTEYFIDKDPDKLEEIKAKGHLSAPIVEVYSGDKLIKSWAGFVPDELNKLQ